MMINVSRRILVLINTVSLMDGTRVMMRVFVRMKQWHGRLFIRKVRDHSRFRCCKLPCGTRNCWESRNMWDKRHLLWIGLQWFMEWKRMKVGRKPRQVVREWTRESELLSIPDDDEDDLSILQKDK